MASLREQIVQDAVAALGGAGKPTGLRVHRSRTRPIESDTLPAVVVFLLGETAEPETHDGDVLRRLRLAVECRAAGEVPDQQLDPLVVWAVQVLKTDAALQARVRQIEEESTEWQAEQASKVYGAAAVVFEITYTTAAEDPEAATP